MRDIVSQIRTLAKPKPIIRRRVTNTRERRKIKSELERILYYVLVGYGGPHPWGSKARPPHPELEPLQIIDQEAGKEIREAIQSVVNEPRFSSQLKLMLIEIDKRIKDIK